jgi:hypothetical protein
MSRDRAELCRETRHSPSHQGLLSNPGPSGYRKSPSSWSRLPLPFPSVLLAVDHVPEAAPRTFHREGFIYGNPAPDMQFLGVRGGLPFGDSGGT